MKKILLSSLLFLLPACTFAEKRIWIGLNAGIAPHTLPLNNKSDFNNAFTKGQFTYLYMSGNVLYTFRDKYQVGVQVALGAIDYSINYYKLSFVRSNVRIGTHLAFGGQPIAAPVIPVTILFNRILNDNAISCYIGVEAGYERYVLNSTAGTSISGVLGGAHFGITFNQNHAVRLNAHVAANYHYSYTDGIHYKIISFPVTVGLVF
jgi:hypothetical protein